jgi:hypothetical protein
MPKPIFCPTAGAIIPGRTNLLGKLTRRVLEAELAIEYVAARSLILAMSLTGAM